MSTNAGATPLLDVRAAAALAGRSPETIRRWVWAGRLPAQRQGRKLLVSRVDLIRLTSGPLVEIADLGQWHRRAAVLAESRTDGAGGSAADLVLDDRWSRQGGDDDAGR